MEAGKQQNEKRETAATGKKKWSTPTVSRESIAGGTKTGHFNPLQEDTFYNDS